MDFIYCYDRKPETPTWATLIQLIDVVYCVNAIVILPLDNL